MTKEQLAQKIAREIYKGKGKLESFHAFQCIRSYFYDLSMDDLEGIAGQYGINIQEAIYSLLTSKYCACQLADEVD